MHADFVRPSGQWPPELVPCSADLQRFDALQARLVNSDDGGVGNPSSPIIIGGAGVSLSTGGTLISGNITTTTGGGVMIGAAAGDFPQLATSGRSRTIAIPVLAAGLHVDLGVIGANLTEESFVSQSVGGVLGVTLLNTNSTLYMEIPPRSLHSGARVATLSIQFMVTQRVSAIPASPIQLVTAASNIANVSQPFTPSVFTVWTTGAKTLGAYAIPATAGTQNGYYFRCITPGTSGALEPTWTSVPGTTVNDGTVLWINVGRSGRYPTANATVDTYFFSGQPQTLSFDPDGAGGNVLDVTINRYLIGASNLNTPTDGTILITGASVSMDSITSLAFQ